MKTTTQQCFKSANDLCTWQNSNCEQCKKGVFYNAKLQRMPQYRCAIQRQIEGQQMGEDEVSQRTFDAVQGKQCQFFMPKVEQPEILDFSKGECFYADEPKDAPQIEVQKVEEPKHEAEPPKRQPTLEELERDFKKNIYDDVQRMLENLTFDGQMRVSFLPLIITQCAWVYAQKSMELAARDKVELLKKLTRTLKMVRQRYDEELAKDLDFTNRKRIETQTDEFLRCVEHDTTMLYFSVRQEFLRCAPEYPYIEQRVNAIISLLFIDLLEEHNHRTDEFIAEKMNNQNLGKTVTHAMTLNLRKGMHGIAGVEGKFNFENANIKLAMRVIAKRLYEVEFEEI